MSDDSWEGFAQENPYWAVLTDPKYKGDFGEQTRNEFFATGEGHIRRVTKAFKTHFNRKITRADTGLDFGSGVGRLLFPMANLCGHAIGVDVSATMRRIARQNAMQLKLGNVECIDSAKISELDDGSLDWVNSYIVFQHIATHIGFAIFEELLDKIRTRGVISIHFTMYKDRRIFSYIDNRTDYFRYTQNGVDEVYISGKPYGDNDMMMNDYDATRIFMILQKKGFRTIVTEMEDQDGMHGGVFYAMKS